MEPGADRPYFSHNPPTEYQKKLFAKVYSFTLNVPDFFLVDGHIEAQASTFVVVPQTEWVCPKCQKKFSGNLPDLEIVKTQHAPHCRT
jgi:hypothetical protein